MTELVPGSGFQVPGEKTVVNVGCTRRRMLKAAAGAAAGVVLGAPARLFAQAPNAPAGGGVERLADNLFVLRLPGEANVVTHVAADGVTLVDGGSAAATDALLTAVAGLPGGGSVHTLVNTHWHPEQTGANERLGQAGATIIAHENTRLWLTTDVTWPWNGRRFARLPKIAQPNKTFYKTLEVKGIQYGYLPDAAHTDGDLYALFPEQNVLVVGEVITGGGWPVVDWVTGGWIGGMVGGLQRVMALTNEQTRIVPAYGPVCGQAEVKAQLEMYNTLYTRLTQLLNKGRGPSEAVEAKPAKEFEAKMGNSDEFVRHAFESLWAYLSPDA